MGVGRGSSGHRVLGREFRVARPMGTVRDKAIRWPRTYEETMRAKPEYRDRDETEVAVLDVLAEHNGDGMSVLAIRAEVDADIDSLEVALERLKSDALIDVNRTNGRTVIAVKDHVVGPGDPGDDGEDLFDSLRDRFSL